MRWPNATTATTAPAAAVLAFHQHRVQGGQNAREARASRRLLPPAVRQQVGQHSRQRVGNVGAVPTTHHIPVELFFVHALERHLARQNLPEENAEAVHVHLVVVWLSQGNLTPRARERAQQILQAKLTPLCNPWTDLRRHVAQRASAATHLVDIRGQCGSLQTGHQPKVEQLQLHVLRKTDIVRFQIYHGFVYVVYIYINACMYACMYM